MENLNLESILSKAVANGEELRTQMKDALAKLNFASPDRKALAEAQKVWDALRKNHKVAATIIGLSEEE